MLNYLNLLREIMKDGIDKGDRTGVGTRSLFTRMLSWDLSLGFPLVTTKKMGIKSVAAELLWFLSGSSDIRKLWEINDKCRIWDANVLAWHGIKEWHDANSYDAGRIYGVQWRDWQKVKGGSVDQIQELVDKIKNRPNDRRMLVLAYNPGEIEEMCLPPCHMFFQCYVGKGKLSLTMYQRSCDTFLGVPYNIASYALLTHMLAGATGLNVGVLSIVFGDVHIYNNHFTQVRQQLDRDPFPLPVLGLTPKGILDYTLDDIKLLDYKSHDAIAAPMAV